MVLSQYLYYQLKRMIQVGETHNMLQASKDWTSSAQDAQVRKFHKSLDQHKVYGRDLDIVLCHFLSYQLIRMIQVGETHNMLQAPKDANPRLSPLRNRKFHKFLDQYKVYGRGLDMVLSQSLYYQLIRMIQVGETHNMLQSSNDWS